MKRVLARVCVWALVLGVAVQSVVAADGLRRAGKDLVAEDMFAVLAGFAVWADFSAEPRPISWIVMGADGRVEKRADGSVEKNFDTPEELIAYFRTRTKERTARGIFITGDVTHLKDTKASQVPLSAHVKSLLANPAWVAARKKSIEALTAACEKAKIDLWVNVTHGGQEQRFTKLTR